MGGGPGYCGFTYRKFKKGGGGYKGTFDEGGRGVCC